MGLTTCSNPGFAVLLPAFRFGKWEKKFLEVVLPKAFVKTAKTSPRAFFSPVISDGVSAIVHVLLPLVWQSRCPASVPSTCFSIYNAEPGWLAKVIDRHARLRLLCGVRTHHAAADWERWHRLSRAQLA